MRFVTTKPARLLIGAALGVLALTGTAAAQDYEDTADAADALAEEGQGDDNTLPLVIVTAERRSENLQDVPVSVGVVDGEAQRDYQSGGQDTLLALSGQVPSLYVESTTGRIFPRFYIRGLGNVDFYLGASQPVSIVQDDVVLEHVVLKSNPVYDVAQVEVLRGPQGSLFGRNTTAGIVKFDTIRPSDTVQARALATYGSFNTMTVDAGVGGPIAGDMLSFRVSGLYQHRDDWVNNAFNGTSADGTVTPQQDAMGGFDERDARLQLLLKPSSNFSMLGSIHGRWFDGTSTLFRRGALTKGSNGIDNLDRDTVRYDEARNNRQRYDTWGGHVTSTYDFGGVELTSITAYESTKGKSRGDTDGGAAADFGGIGFGQSQGRVRDLDQWTQEVRLASNDDGAFRWQVGGLYFDSRDVTEFYQRAYFLTTAARNPNNWVRLNNKNVSWAGFGQLSYDFTPNFTLTAGARVTEDTKETRLVKTANTAANVVTYTGRRYVKLSDTKPSWDVSALYRVSDDFSLYARVAQGFRGPTIQGRSAVFNADFTTADSETILSWEAGFKSEIGRTLRLNGTVFTYTVDDIQLNGNDSNGNGVLFNADKAKAYGAELEADWRPVENLSINAGLSLLHTEIEDKRVFAQACSLNGVLVCTVQDPYFTKGSGTGTTYFAQIDGNPLPNAPEYNVNFSARYDIPAASEGKFFISTDWNLQGYTNFVLYKTKEFYADGNFEGGLKIGYTGGNGAWEVAAFARNITNEKNLTGVIENYMAAVVNDPRVIGVSLSGRIK